MGVSVCGESLADSAVVSWRREVTPSFRKTLLRWYSTVEVVMYRRLAISALVTPAAAWRATWVSCGVRPNGLCACGVSRLD